MLLIPFLQIPEADAARTPNLIIVKVSPHYDDPFISYHKYVQSYSVEVANYGSGASKATTMDFYIRTYDGKALKKTIPIRAMNAGKIIRVTFSMNKGTDGSLKDGYAIVNPKKTFKEISFRDNLKRFGLKDTMLKSDTKTVTEYWTTSTTQNIQGHDDFNVTQYNSPLSTKNGINQIVCDLRKYPPDESYNSYWQFIARVQVKVPASLQNKTKIKIKKANGSFNEKTPQTVIDNETLEATWLSWEQKSYITDVIVTITDSNLETKTAYREPIRMWDEYGTELSTNENRYVSEYYNSTLTTYTNHTATYTYTTATIYSVHNSNITKLQVMGNPRNYYCAGWFINPSADSISKLTGIYYTKDIYGSEYLNTRTGSKINSVTWGVNQKIRDVNKIGFIIEGNNIKGFSNFKTMGFNSWTWKELY